MWNRWLLRAIFASLIWVNCSKVLEAAVGSDSVITRIWLIGPLLAWMAWLYRLLARRFTADHAESLLLLLFTTIVTGHSVARAAQDGPTLAVSAFLAWCAWVGWAAYLCARGDAFQIAIRVAWWFTTLGTLHALIVLWETSTSIPILKASTIGQVTRNYGIAVSVAVLGAQLASGILCSLFLGLVERKRIRRTILALSAAIQTGALISTGARGPALFLLVSLSISATPLLLGRARLIVRTGAVLCVTAMACIAFFSTRQPERLEAYVSFLRESLSLHDEGNTGRIERWKEGVATATRSPVQTIVGMGAGSTSVIPALTGTEAPTYESSLIKLFVELGAIGLASWILLLLYIGTRTFIAYLSVMRHTLGAARLPQVTIAAFTGLSVFMLLEHLIHDMLSTWVFAAYFWTILGCAAGVVRQHFRRSRIPAKTSVTSRTFNELPPAIREP